MRDSLKNLEKHSQIYFHVFRNKLCLASNEINAPKRAFFKMLHPSSFSIIYVTSSSSLSSSYIIPVLLSFPSVSQGIWIQIRNGLRRGMHHSFISKIWDRKMRPEFGRGFRILHCWYEHEVRLCSQRSVRSETAFQTCHQHWNFGNIVRSKRFVQILRWNHTYVYSRRIAENVECE